MESKAVVKPTIESTYDVAEFAKISRETFGVNPECVIAAFRLKGIKEATESEAKKIVDEFMNREVK